MKYFKYLALALIIALPSKMFAGNFFAIPSTDIFNIGNSQITAPYDLRDRRTYIQVTNPVATAKRIHIQIFQQDRECLELNFFDDLTGNDTVVYDLDNIINNSGSAVPINLQYDSYGYVVVTSIDSTGSVFFGEEGQLIGNFRIIDEKDYEYRSNMVGVVAAFSGDFTNLKIANFNTVDGAMYSDIIGYAFEVGQIIEATANNLDDGFSFDIFVFDMNEEPISCDRRNFACGPGKVMNYGINEDYPASRGDNLLCPGGGLADPQGGFISFQNGSNDIQLPGTPDSDDNFLLFVGLNNNDGTGSIDSWIVFEED